VNSEILFVVFMVAVSQQSKLSEVPILMYWNLYWKLY